MLWPPKEVVSAEPALVSVTKAINAETRHCCPLSDNSQATYKYLTVHEYFIQY